MQIASSQSAHLSTNDHRSSTGHHGNWVDVVVLGAFAAQLALLIGDRGSVAAIILASIAGLFWWLGYGQSDEAADPVAIGNAAGIMIGLSIGFPQLLLPIAIAAPVVLFTGLRRIWAIGRRRDVIYLLFTMMLSAAGAAWLAINLHLLPR